MEERITALLLCLPIEQPGRWPWITSSHLIPSADSSDLTTSLPRAAHLSPAPQTALVCKSLQTRERIINCHRLGPRSDTPPQSYSTSGATKRDQRRRELDPEVATPAATLPRRAAASHQLRWGCSQPSSTPGIPTSPAQIVCSPILSSPVR